MRDETIGSYLGQLAARVPAPGGGAAAALHAAQSAALVAMVARYSNGARYDTDLMARIFTEADGVRDQAVKTAAADAAAFGAVSAAYQLPKDTHGQKEARSAAIAEALSGAARPPADVIRLARRLIELAEQLLPAGNRNVITDVAAAAEAARAAAVTAQVNIEVNLRGLKDPSVLGELASMAEVTDDVVARADRVVAAVREEISR
jgi:formiminotetrahydrofolate cyclodeaminase